MVLCKLVAKHCHFTHSSLKQWFSNLSWRHPCPTHFECFPHLSHLFQIINSLIETARPYLGVSNKADNQTVQGRGASRTGLRTTALKRPTGHRCNAATVSTLVNFFGLKAAKKYFRHGPAQIGCKKWSHRDLNSDHWIQSANHYTMKPYLEQPLLTGPQRLSPVPN